MNNRAAVVLAVVAIWLAPSAAAACSPVFPTFEQVLASSSPIVIGRVVQENGDRSYTVEVERVVRGSVGRTVLVTNWSTYCGDRLVMNGLPAGTRLMIALEVPSTATMAPVDALAPFWFVDRGRVHGMVEGTPEARTLAELAAHIAALPDTAAEPEPAPTTAVPPLLALPLGLLVLAYFLARPMSRRPAD
jgi:hypothetical protein